MTPEGRVKQRIKKILDGFGVWYFMPMMMGIGRAGIPDFICCVGGLFVAIEAKAGDGTPTKIQEYEMGRIGEAGGLVILVNEDGLLKLHEMLAGMICANATAYVQSTNVQLRGH